MGLAKIIYVTGTDTGVGKTVLTALLLQYLREKGVNALAVKPFCSGSREDVKILKALQDNVLTNDEINPYYFKAAVAPMVAARMRRQNISLHSVLRKIKAVQKRCALLLIEGAGGLLAPLGEGFTNRDIIANTADLVLIAGHNRLGTINHTTLTVESMQGKGIQRIKVVLMDGEVEDGTTETNCEILGETVPGVEIFRFPYLGVNHSFPIVSKQYSKKTKKTLALISRFDNLSPFF